MKIKTLLSFLKYDITKWFYFNKSDLLLNDTLIKKECFFGPFVGEFGHLLSHIVPLLSYLKEKGVDVHYIGPAIHKAYFYDSKSNLIVKSYTDLRDFYSEVAPRCNDQIFPDDVKHQISIFKNDAKKSDLPFWDISKKSYYWFGICLWMYEKKYLHIYTQFSGVKKLNQIVLFARKKGSHSDVRGDDWDFQEVIDHIINNTNYNIIILGHPAYSHVLKESKRVRSILTNDNKVILEECSKSKFIINQLSGTHYLGLYSDTNVILLLKGNNIDYSNYLKDLKYRLLLNPSIDLLKSSSLNDITKNLTEK